MTIETGKGSFCFIGFGVVLLVASLYFSISFDKAKESIGIQRSQLSAVVPSGTALSLIPLSQLSGEAAQKDILQVRVINQFRDIQDSVIDKLLKYSNDEKFALLVLEGFDKNSFGLANIPSNRAKEVGNFLKEVSYNFPNNAKLQLEIARAFRSLYESRGATKDEKQQFLDRLGTTIARLEKLQPDDDVVKYGADLISGLYYQRKRQLDAALEYMAKADEIAPLKEKYKTSFNMGNIYSDLAIEEKDKEKAEAFYKKSIDYLLKSEKLAESQNMNFWQPRFAIGYIYFQIGNDNESVEAFLKSCEVAVAAGEGNLFTQYISKVKDIDRLCKIKSFANRFNDVCKVK